MKNIARLILAAFTAAAVPAAFAAGEGTASAAAKPAVQKQKIKNNFKRPAAASLKALKGARGKPFDSGWVFIDGQFVEPPYVVERYGTVLRVNGFQVTSDIVPWEEFVKTQSGVVATKVEAPAAPAEEPQEPEPEPEVEEEEEDDDAASSLDDLFDDDPAPKAAKKKTAKRKTSKPRPRKPVATVTYSFEGEFAANDKSNALLARINTERDRLDQRLRSGGILCVSTRYSSVAVDGGVVAKRAMEKLPGLMKAATSAEALADSVRSNGLVFFHAPFCADLFRNKYSYLKLFERLKSIKEKEEEAKWKKLGL